MENSSLGLTLGVVFGVIAGLPATVLILASGRKKEMPPERGRVSRPSTPERKQLQDNPVVISDDDLAALLAGRNPEGAQPARLLAGGKQ